MPPTSHRKIYILLGLILVLVLVNTAMSFKSYVLPGSSAGMTPGNAFFDFQNANVSGKITKVEGQMLTIENRSGISKQFPASKTITINTSANMVAATPSSDLKKIEIGKEYNISFIAQNGNFEVNNVFMNQPAVVGIIPPPPPLPPGGPAGLPSAPATKPVVSGSSAPAAPAATGPLSDQPAPSTAPTAKPASSTQP